MAKTFYHPKAQWPEFITLGEFTVAIGYFDAGKNFTPKYSWSCRLCGISAANSDTKEEAQEKGRTHLRHHVERAAKVEAIADPRARAIVKVLGPALRERYGGFPSLEAATALAEQIMAALDEETE